MTSSPEVTTNEPSLQQRTFPSSVRTHSPTPAATDSSTALEPASASTTSFGFIGLGATQVPNTLIGPTATNGGAQALSGPTIASSPTKVVASPQHHTSPR
jgi:hypothetical protein